MGIAITIKEFLDQENIYYDLVEHPYSRCSMESAEAAHIPGDQLAKCVVLGDDEGYLLAVVPATHKIDLGLLERYLGRKLSLATESEIYKLFYDCEIGAVPALGQAYGYDTIMDDRLMDCEDIYFEAGDHVELVHLTGEEFQAIMANTEHAQFSSHV